MSAEILALVLYLLGLLYVFLDYRQERCRDTYTVAEALTLGAAWPALTLFAFFEQLVEAWTEGR